MRMIEWAFLLAGGLAAGTFMAVLYFGGLWWTLLRLPGARSPALLAFGSYLLRMAVCLAGFVVLARASWLAVGAAGAAFLASRSALLRLWGPSSAREAGGDGTVSDQVTPIRSAGRK